MATKDLVKGYCKESKCEYDVYTKEKTDELLAKQSENTVNNFYNKTTVDNKLALKTETINIEFDYEMRIIKNSVSTTVKSGKITIPFTFKKQGAMVYLNPPKIVTTKNGLENPYINSDGAIEFDFDFDLSVEKLNVSLSASGLATLSKYRPMSNKIIYKTTDNTLTIEIGQDSDNKTFVNYYSTSTEPGTFDINYNIDPIYMVGNTD